jgi:hypothetical protein
VASSSTSADGRRTIQFVARDGKCRSIRFGRMPMRASEILCQHVELMVAAINSGTALDSDAATWLASTSDFMHARLAAVGLTTPRLRTVAKLGEFVARFIAGRTDVKRQTTLNLKMFGNRLVAFFGKDRDITTIKRSDADAWVIHLKAHYAPGTWARTIKGRGSCSRPPSGPRSSPATRSRT